MTTSRPGGYGNLVSGIRQLLGDARRQAARSTNTLLTATYWEIGRRIVEFEQGGKGRAGYGQALLERLAKDLGGRLGRGFSRQNLQQMRQFYLVYPPAKIRQTPSGKLTSGTLQEPGDRQLAPSPAPSTALQPRALAFPLSWSHYVLLLSVDNPQARDFYEAEALRAGWSVRQLDRQIGSQFYERTALSRNKAAMLLKAARPRPGESAAPDEEIKDPYVLEFLGLKDEYSENEMEEALIHHLESFLLELGDDFAFVARQKRLRVGEVWYRIDLVFFHRHLRCLILIELKIGSFSAADAGQMHLYLNYARQHWMRPGENPPVGLILCSKKNQTVARYALEGLPNKVLASEYRTTLPQEQELVTELRQTQKALEARATVRRRRSDPGG